MGTQSTWGQNEETLSTHPARSETKKVTDKEPTRPVRNTRTWMKTTSYGKTKQRLFVGLLLGLLLLSTQAQALSIEQPPICCKGNHARCNSCKEGLSEEEYCKKSLPRVPPGCNREGCCKAFTAKCRACHRGVSKEAFCKRKPKVPGCERNGAQCKKDPSASGCKWFKCCKKYTSKCLACAQDKSEEEFCKKYKKFGIPGCEKLG